MMNPIFDTPEGKAQLAREAAQSAYADAQRAQAQTPTRGLAADYGRYNQRLTGALAGTRNTMLTAAQREQAWTAVKAVADDARATFDKWSAMPADAVAEIAARESGRMSPRAVRESAQAVNAAQHQKDQISRAAAEAVADEKWTAGKFVAQLAKRGIYVVPDASGRILGG